MAEELEKQEKSRASFLANVSHDLRTPMTTISGFVQGILDDTIPKEKEKEYLKVVLSETHRLSDLISSFIDASKYDAGEIKLYITETDINGMLKNAVTQFEQGISGKNLTVNFELDPQVTGVLADQQAISRVVVNLIDNAVKFSKQDGTLFVSTKSEGQKVYVKIENTGEEISGEDLKYIWDRFYKTDKSRLRDKKGVGLGLYIVKNIIAKHGEKITVTCENGIISFTFSLQNNI
ncbi:MAG: HAMP domain-containing histidine kinase [Clostridia bacterium]|nr:HAMP domain-containing histidine kinase [Clostridia bacterium]